MYRCQCGVVQWDSTSGVRYLTTSETQTGKRNWVRRTTACGRWCGVIGWDTAEYLGSSSWQNHFGLGHGHCSLLLWYRQIHPTYTDRAINVFWARYWDTDEYIGSSQQHYLGQGHCSLLLAESRYAYVPASIILVLIMPNVKNFTSIKHRLSQLK